MVHGTGDEVKSPCLEFIVAEAKQKQPLLSRPNWVDRIQRVSFIELFEKYRRRMVHEETGLPFEPTRRRAAHTIESLAFETGGTLRLALKVFFPFCALLFLLSFLWDFQEIIRSCSVAGIIGFSTNWVAIKMLFWPRESRPIFGHGLIPSQRDLLIDKVASEVLEKLINEELILRKIDETRLVSKFSRAIIDKLYTLVSDREFKDDLRNMVLTYVGELTSNAEFRDSMARRAEESLEEFAGSSFRSWLVRRLKEVWRAPLIEVLNHQIQNLEGTVDEGLSEVDGVLRRLPDALEARQEAIDRVLTTMLVGLVREVDVRAIVYEQLSTVTPEQLEKGFREFSDDKLSFITLLGGLLGLVGGTLIVWPLPSIAALVLIGVVLTLLDVLIHPLMQSTYWPKKRN